MKDERYEEAAKHRDEIDRQRKHDADGPPSAGGKVSQPGNA